MIEYILTGSELSWKKHKQYKSLATNQNPIYNLQSKHYEDAHVNSLRENKQNSQDKSWEIV